jgi:hypothetical protein
MQWGETLSNKTRIPQDFPIHHPTDKVGIHPMATPLLTIHVADPWKANRADPNTKYKP